MQIVDEKNGGSDAAATTDARYDPDFVRRTLRRVDWRLLPLLGLLYSIDVIDRTNLAMARTAGMNKDLGMDIGSRYSIITMIFFPPYVLFQVPGNIVLQYIGPRTFLTISVAGWGISQIGMAFVTSWRTLCFCRVLLAILEAGFFPALAFLITTWYKRHEVQKRLAIFYLLAIVLDGFSALLASAIAKLGGKAGMSGWRWVFLLEGLGTLCLCPIAWVFVPDFPDKNRFLTEDQTQLILDRVEEDRGDSLPDKLIAAKVLRHLRDPFLWMYGLMFNCVTMPGAAMAFFIPTILSGMGFSETMSLLLTTPPYIAAAISTFFFAWISDKTKKRAIWLGVQTLMSITGLMITGYATPHGARYLGLFLINMGASGSIPGIIAYNANNVTTHTKRAVSTGVIVAFGGVGGVFATTVYRQQDFPRYLNGLWATMGCQFLLLMLLAVNTLILNRRNRSARLGNVVLEETPGFLYTL
ncbi:uncharacterized protein LACBIDRAFT_298947 [Laccaria bicolor S238N-H82]|uniref:Predicted protein n=1 Tax=Laccaria bicolor (strain S238N-H82 / ATCC MYA-4686) TaxID=486041 RepID=B0DDN6_LACBS|nr:uncharacterized protein LACBIDRAFT_298947 [Laccaria bicolor S238N-H82]EDR07121.1 predicted protein [Laccaria bicolor S238N-H82]|eukprot:XP_001882052.1 predicted protein [Laccaria bicolor S238N-H82]